MKFNKMLVTPSLSFLFDKVYENALEDVIAYYSMHIFDYNILFSIK